MYPQPVLCSLTEIETEMGIFSLSETQRETETKYKRESEHVKCNSNWN